MKEADINDMELGNILFGNSRGKYQVEPREDYQNVFCQFLSDNGFDGYGVYKHNNEWGFENDIFIIRPYYWGDDEEKIALPNFVYKPTKLEISWYKYPMRDAYSNQDISLEDFSIILEECSKSMSDIKEEGRKTILDTLATCSDQILGLAYMYATDLVKYGIDVRNEYNTALELTQGLDRAYQRGRKDAMADLVRCKDCEYGQDELKFQCKRHKGLDVDGFWYCSDAIRRERKNSNEINQRSKLCK